MRKVKAVTKKGTPKDMSKMPMMGGMGSAVPDVPPKKKKKKPVVKMAKMYGAKA